MVSGLCQGCSDLSPKASSVRLAHFKAQTEQSWSPRWRQSQARVSGGGGATGLSEEPLHILEMLNKTGSTECSVD